MIAPKLNQQDIDDIPKHLRKDLEFIFVDRIEQALAQALMAESPAPNGAKPRRTARRRAAASSPDGAKRKAPARAKGRR